MVVLIGFTVLTGQVVRIKVMEADRYLEHGQAQRVRSVILPAGRGAIVDRNGADLALSVGGGAVAVTPAEIGDVARVAFGLAPLLEVTPDELVEPLTRDAEFVYVARQVDEETIASVEALELEGVSVLDEAQRVNPTGELARSVIGRVDVDGAGVSGLELQWDDVLAGEAGRLLVETDPNGNTIAAGDNRRDPADQGDDLLLTIDRELQFEVERALAAQVDALGARGGSAIIAQPDTGDILAMANVTAFDEETGEFLPAETDSENRAVTALFEPGSVNKVITLAAALDRGVVSPDTVSAVPPTLLVGDHEFSDEGVDAARSLAVREVLAQSSNVGTIQIAQQLGAEALVEELHDFGFGEPTALDFPHEAASAVLPVEQWSGTSIGTIPIGQGVAVTPIQLLAAINVIASGGDYVAPRLVTGWRDSRGELHEVDALPRREGVVTRETASQMAAMMTGVVDAGTGQAAAVEGYPVAGKTGTPRKPLPTGGYGENAEDYRYMPNFVGFLPAGNPQLTILVMLDEPTAATTGGTAAAPLFSHLAQVAIRSERIPPPPVVSATPPPASDLPASDGSGSGGAGSDPAVAAAG